MFEEYDDVDLGPLNDDINLYGNFQLFKVKLIPIYFKGVLENYLLLHYHNCCCFLILLQVLPKAIIYQVLNTILHHFLDGLVASKETESLLSAVEKIKPDHIQIW